MRFLFVIFLLVVFSCLSCDSFSKENKIHKIDAVIDYSKVDVSPSFKKCENLSIKDKKVCFIEEISHRIQFSLVIHNFTTKEFISETVLIDLLIDASGIFKLKKITASNKINNQLPKLDSILRSAINNLPKITPAFKEGIPVTVQYKLPVKITIKEVVD
jgi:hypothetical protein